MLLTFQKGCAPAEGVEEHPLSLPKAEKIPDVQTSLVTLVVLGKDVLEVLRLETSFVIVCHAIAAMLIFVQTVEPNAEEGIRKPAADGRI